MQRFTPKAPASWTGTPSRRRFANLSARPPSSCRFAADQDRPFAELARSRTPAPLPVTLANVAAALCN